MPGINFCLIVDDDSLLVRAFADELKNYFLAKNIEFVVCDGKKDIELTISNAKDNNLLIAILDLWFIDKAKNVSNESEGFEILELLRTIWENSYIIILSGHINGKVKDQLENYKNIAIIEKPIAPLQFIPILEKLLEQM